MTLEHENIILMKRFFQEVWNQGKEETIDELYALQGRSHGLGEQFKDGTEQFKQLHRLFHQTCCDIHVKVDDMIAAGDRVALRATVKMVHKATKKPLEFSGGGFAYIRQGKIVEAWNGWDFLSILQVLGAVPEDILAQALQRKS